MKSPKLSPAMAQVWEQWSAKQMQKVPSTKRKGPRMVFTAEQRKIRRMEYLAGWYAKKSERLKAQAEALRSFGV